MKIDTIYLIHHSHTDIGFTNDQPVVWELNTRFIDEAKAHRLGLEAKQIPLFQQLGEPVATPQHLPDRGGLLTFPDEPVLTLHLKAGEDSTILVRLLNASDEEQIATVGSGLLQIQKAAACDVLGKSLHALEVHQGSVSVTIPARRVAVVRLEIQNL